MSVKRVGGTGYGGRCFIGCVADHDPEEPVPPSERRPRVGALQGFQLLTEREVFEDNRSVPAARQRERPEQHEDRHQHALIVSWRESGIKP
jgi:hypothetical protein